MKIRRLDRRNQGYTRIEWVLDYYEGPKRIRRFYYSKGEAEAAADSVRAQHKHAGQSWVELTPKERADLMLIVSEARERKVELRQVWEAYKTGKLDAAPMLRCTLKQAIRETLEWREGENLRERYLKELEAYLNRFASGRTEAFIDTIGVVEIQSWFAGRKEALSTKKANMGRLGSMFDVAWKKGYIKENPCLKLPTIKLEPEAPTIFTPMQMEALLKESWKRREQTPAMLTYLILGAFLGIRPEEMEKLKWGDIDLGHGTVTITAAASKTSRRRSIEIRKLHPGETNGDTKQKEIKSTPLEWLKLCTRGHADEFVLPAEITLKRYRKTLREAAGLEKWHQDIMRHSAASYLLKFHGDAGKVANWLGHSARTLQRHYMDVVNETNCAAFWDLTPEALKINGGGEK